MIEMNSSSEILTSSINNGVRDENSLKLYKYRWFILLLFCLYSSANFEQYLQYSIITNIIARYYDIDTFTVSWTSLIFMISYIVLFIPASYIMEMYDLRKISVLTTSLTTLGAGIKLFSVSPDKFYIVLIGQSFCAVAQVFIMSLPSKVAAVWFGKNEVSTACAFAVVGTQLGVAIGCVLSPNVIKNDEDINVIGDQLFYLLLYTAVANFIICLFVVVFFEAKPKTPPSRSQAVLLGSGRTSFQYLQSLFKLVKNRDYLCLLVAIGIGNGIWNATGIELNTMYLFYFPNKEEEAGFLALSTIVAGGCIASIIFGYILDRTHKFKLTTFTILLLASCGYLAVTFVLEQQNQVSTFAVVIFFGFFAAGSLTVGFEYAVELTHPEPETTSLALMNAVILFFGLIFAVMIDTTHPEITFFWTNLIITLCLILSSMFVLFISSKLRRLEANIIIDHTNELQDDM